LSISIKAGPVSILCGIGETSVIETGLDGLVGFVPTVTALHAKLIDKTSKANQYPFGNNLFTGIKVEIVFFTDFSLDNRKLL
jgi:hypothetical protein